MKIIASLAIAAFTFTALPAAQAGDCYIGTGHHGIIISTNSYAPRCVPQYVAPRYVSTTELYRTVQTQWAYDSFGNAFPYNVMVITYADYYSDGSSRTYNRTYRM
jgi:hypothetical protein